jgi:hypothetical protein
MAMNKNEIENWALRVIDQVQKHQPNEDFHVELKTEWIDPLKAARLIAGQANAAHGEPVLWLVGVNQDLGVVGASHMELATWYEKIKSQFDGLAPEMLDLNIPVNGFTVVALLFETDRAPFVIKNPIYGKRKGGVEYEIPWRENTATRTARRDQLIKLLSPLQNVPQLEFLSGDLICNPLKDGGASELEWTLHLEIYVSTNRPEPHVFIPYHRCKVSLLIRELLHSYPFETLVFSTPRDSLTISATRTEMRIEGPGMAHLHGYTRTTDLGLDAIHGDVAVNGTLPIIGSDRPITLEEEMKLRLAAAADDRRIVWILNKTNE